MSGPLGSSQWMYSSGGFYPTEIDQSLMFDGSSYLSRTPSVAGNRKTWTWSGWVKRSKLSQLQFLFQQGSDANNATSFKINSNDTLSYDHADAGSTTYQATTSALFRDASAWYHIVLAQNTTEATSSTRIKIYVNGVDQSFSSATYPSLNFDADVNTTNSIRISGQVSATLFPIDGYLADTYLVDGTALDPTSFGEFKNGVWIPKAYTGSYGTNGFHLTYQDDTVSEGFNTVTYTGNGATQSISGIGFSPDLVWIKGRSSSSQDHLLADSVRGISRRLLSNTTAPEIFQSGFQITAFNSDGFTVVDDTNGGYNVNGSVGGTFSGAAAYVGWCWDAGDSTVSNTAGSITSSVRANPAYGFSVVSWSSSSYSDTIGHGLGVAPDMIIAKERSISRNWLVYHKSLGNDYYLHLDTNEAQKTPNSGRLQVSGTDNFICGTDGTAQIAYCFSEIAGYSKFGSYTGNGSASGPTVTLGFKPAFVMIKRTDVANSWVMYDNTRQTTNPKDLRVLADSSDFEFDGNEYITFTDTGFEIQYSGNLTNASGGTYIYMAFADTRDLAFWRDQSGNGNDWQPTNLNYQDTVFDSPTNNYATLNPLAPSGGTFSNGNLSWSSATTDGRFALSTISPSTDGKWYCEVNIGSKASTYWTVGLFAYPATALPRILYRSDGAIYLDGSNVATVSSFTQNDVIGMAYDGSTRSLTLYKNNTSLGSWTASSTTINYFFGCASDNSGSSANYTLNFGQSGFTYTPPDGFLALSTANLPEPSISPLYGASPQDHFNTVLYTGDGATTQNVTGVGFQPDFTWIKERSSTSGHVLADSVRGYDKYLVSNETIAEGTGVLNSALSDGFQTTNSGATNQSGQTYVGWNWKASNATAVSNTAGTITSQVSANPTAGFSIVSYTGTGVNATVGHGLDVAPDMVIVKSRGPVLRDWVVYNSSEGATKYMYLSTTAASTSSSTRWNDTEPTSDVFSLGTSGATNASENFIAYCFHDVEGYSKFGSYTGNGSTDGTFVYTGFRPAYVLIKKNTIEQWHIFDSARNGYNVVNHPLYANLPNGEGTYNYIDFVSNGIKIITSNAGVNASGGTYIYMAFAENPFKYANAR